jgi:hypothetical protein
MPGGDGCRRPNPTPASGLLFGLSVNGLCADDDDLFHPSTTDAAPSLAAVSLERPPPGAEPRWAPVSGPSPRQPCAGQGLPPIRSVSVSSSTPTDSKAAAASVNSTG